MASNHLKLLLLDSASSDAHSREHLIREFPCVIGREASQVNLVLDNQSISRRHTRFTRGNGGFYVEDMQSRNGTFLNDLRINGKQLVKSGDVVRLGRQTRAKIEVMENPSGQSSGSISLSSSSGRPSITGSRKPTSHHETKTLSVLLEVTKNLNSSLDRDTVLRRVVDAVIELAKVERGFLLLGPPDKLEIAIARNQDKQPLPPEQHRLSQSTLCEILSSHDPKCIFDAASDEELKNKASIAALHLRTILGVPLYVHDHHGGEEHERFVGLIYADSTEKSPAEAHRVLDLLSALGSHAAIAIENARLHRHLLEKERLEEDLKIAREIQDSLMPQEIPQTESLEVAAVSIPLQAVGGDYFMLRKMGEDNLAVAVGDVMGKGLPASLMMAVLHASLEALLFDESPQTDLIAKLNNLLASQKAKNKFITFFYGIFEGRKFRYVNAGHNPPLVFRSDGSFEELVDGGMILGAMEGAPYLEGETELHPGDLLLLYTDGLIESENAAGEEFGEDRVRAFGAASTRLSSAEVLTTLRQELDEFCGDHPLKDDLTLLAIRPDD